MSKFLCNIDLAQTELQNAVIQNLATPPSSPAEGQIYYDTALDTYRGWDGTQWLDLADNGVTDLSNTPTSTNVEIQSSSGTNTTIAAATTTLAGVMLASDKLKLDGIEANAKDDQNASEVPYDNSTSGYTATDVQAAIDETKVYVDNAVTGALSYVGGYNASTNTPALDESGTFSGTIATSTSTAIVGTGTAFTTELSAGDVLIVSGEAHVIASITDATNLVLETATSGTASGLSYYTTTVLSKGDTYTVTANGTFFTEDVQVGDILIAEIDNPTSLTDWTRVNKNIPDIVDSSETDKGIIEIATQIEVDNGVDDLRAVTPLKLATYLSNIGSPIKVSLDIVGDDSTTDFLLTHNLGTKDVNVQLYDKTTDATVNACVVRTNTNAITASFAVAPATGQDYRAVIIG